ncbi:LysR family transcriptional regulator [Paenibacillus abyssi]|uniref:LysR family transcriptional regulator n=1 Tax=Paenibacillus abyssi TaxID=1340531 RepID=A0A917CY64_9BACL|nr:LysR family transcriptional regulator [Paenibacillus abyssi]GGG00730.1 LysR family transcriptional regulator [Paenibacillus abyssi]
MNLEQIKTFISVHQLGSFQKAAEQLYLPQPTVSHRIHQLEKNLGKRLIERRKGENRLTLEGKAFVPYALKIIEAIDQGQVAVEKVALGGRSKLEICCTNSLSAYVLTDLLKSFIDKFPQIHIKVQSFSTLEVIHHVKMGSCRIGLSRYSIEDSSLTFRLINNEHIYFIVSSKHPLARKSSISLREVAKQPLILYQKGTQYRETIEFTFNRMNIPYHIHYEMNNLELIKQLVTGNYGATLFAPSYMGEELKSGSLVKIPIRNNPFPMRPTFIVCDKEKLSAEDKLFYDHVIAALAVNLPS